MARLLAMRRLTSLLAGLLGAWLSSMMLCSLPPRLLAVILAALLASLLRWISTMLASRLLPRPVALATLSGHVDTFLGEMLRYCDPAMEERMKVRRRYYLLLC